MKKLKEMQNDFCQREIYVGIDKSTNMPIYKKVNVLTTNTRLFVYTSNTRLFVYTSGGEEIGQAGVGKAKDFDFNALYKIATEKSGSKIKIA